MQSDPELLNQLQRTARALSLSRAIVFVDTELGDPNHPTKPYRGYYGKDAENKDVIALAPNLSIGALYAVILHEAAHVYLKHVVLPDHEAAAHELSSIWAVSIARREPTDERELIGWLARLETYHQQNRNAYQFSKGANAGRIIPSPDMVRTMNQNAARAGADVCVSLRGSIL